MESHKLKTGASLVVFDKDQNPKTLYKLERENFAENTVTLEIKDKAGKVKSSETLPFRSFLINYGAICFTEISGFGVIPGNGARDTGGFDTQILRGYIRSLGASDNDDGQGIVVGTDDGTLLPLARDNYLLGAKIEHGTGAGQFDYAGSDVNNPVLDGDTFYIDLTREFTNNSGGAITVKEVGLIIRQGPLVAGGVNYFLSTRDIVTPTTVNDGDGLHVTIRLNFDESSGLTYNYGLCKRNVHGGYLSPTNTAGNSVTPANPWEYIEALSVSYDVEEGHDQWGLLIGSGASALNINDYNLDAQITHGSGIGEMWHHRTDDGAAFYVATSGTHTLVSRIFSNLSSSSVTIKEIGAVSSWNEGASNDNILIARLLTGPVTVDPEEAILVSFDFYAETP